MHNLKPPVKEFYTEQEIADAVGVSLTLLHRILDEHIFNDGTPRPAELRFTSSDLVLIEFWRDSMPNAKVLRMPGATSA
ncbi:MAG TPA: hypothetical protein VN622_11170 [Clostridia bacterium]|nr:hypothetical protein [Clostridia bacterium]